MSSQAAAAVQPMDGSPQAKVRSWAERITAQAFARNDTAKAHVAALFELALARRMERVFARHARVQVEARRFGARVGASPPQPPEPDPKRLRSRLDAMAGLFCPEDNFEQAVSRHRSACLEAFRLCLGLAPGRLDDPARAAEVLPAGTAEAVAAAVRLFAEADAGHNAETGGLLSHALAVGTAARVLAEAAGHDAAEIVFAAAFVHDAGRALLALADPEGAARARDLARAENIALNAAEERVFGLTHAAALGPFLRRRVLEAGLKEACLCHHIPDLSRRQAEAGLIHLADIAAHAVGRGGGGEFLVPRLRSGALEAASIRPEALVRAAEAIEPEPEFATETGLAQPLGNQSTGPECPFEFY